MSPILKRSVAFLVLLAALAAPILAQEKKPALTLESIQVEPASPGPGTLCHLSVTLSNSGERTASALEFVVKINGRELAAYKDRLYLKPVEPGAPREIHLYNFWSTESSRPAPADGKLTLEVTLTRAAWMQKETKDGAEVWSAAGQVEGLPVTKTVTLKMGKASP